MLKFLIIEKVIISLYKKFKRDNIMLDVNNSPFLKGIKDLPLSKQVEKMVKFIGWHVDFNNPLKVKYQNKENDTKPYTVQIINLSKIGAYIFYTRRNGGYSGRFWVTYEDFDDDNLQKIYDRIIEEYGDKLD